MSETKNMINKMVRAYAGLFSILKLSPLPEIEMVRGGSWCQHYPGGTNFSEVYLHRDSRDPSSWNLINRWGSSQMSWDVEDVITTNLNFKEGMGKLIKASLSLSFNLSKPTT